MRDAYDVVVVGSGFGGAVTACRLAQAGKKVLVLERGDAWPPGSFARSPLELSTNMWDPSEGLYGLFDLWSFRRLDAVVASGLGGGSLVYANVAMRMPESWFDRVARDWPLRYQDLARFYPAVEQMLGATPVPADLAARVPKSAAFDAAARGAGVEPVPARLAVTFAPREEYLGSPVGEPSDNLHAARRRSCVLCGQCDFGCNEGAKNTLDLTYLSRAADAGADVRVLREVKRITAVRNGADESYVVHYVTHRPPRRRWEREPRRPGVVLELSQVRARTVVMAAGTFGTTRLLLANRAGLPGLGSALGTRFSGNGDALGFTTGGRREVDSQRGPVITRIARDDAAGFLIEDGGYPSVLAWIGESLQPSIVWRGGRLAAQRAWQRARRRERSDVGASVSRMLGRMGVSRTTAPLLGMGMDPGNGRMRLAGTWLDLDWSPRAEGSAAYFTSVLDGMRTFAETSGSRYRSGPSSWLSRGITAHPLGGCPMGAGAGVGVVDDTGRSFGHPGIYVADGSAMPTAIGANPSLTIAAFAERVSQAIVADRP
ncbi:MAG: hypothetical protein ABS81_11330 [Pseudonocardia sp. SCN 72-86]|nr:MAG: hypothetical protein ABS81_11330 [Pseudonocardia sp. SCN 72-86]